MKTLYYFLALSLLISCSSTPEKKQPPLTDVPYDWATHHQDTWPQVVLTNEFEFKERVAGASFGASSFLVMTESRKDTFMCTAKHLLGEAMGIKPAITLDSFDILLTKWEVMPRTATLTADIIAVENILTKEQNGRDIALFNIEEKAHQIQPLQARFTPVKEKEELFVLGCAYADENCHQKVYSVLGLGYDDEEGGDGQLIVAMLDKVVMSGFSGAPVVDKQGFVVGIVCSSAKGEGAEYIFVEPITTVQKYLK